VRNLWPHRRWLNHRCGRSGESGGVSRPAELLIPTARLRLQGRNAVGLGRVLIKTLSMSAIGGKADISRTSPNVRF
jgi:hypothetical protein